MNKEFDHDKKESAYRKLYTQAKRFYDAGVFRSDTDKNALSELKIQTETIRKERQRLFDERRDINKRLREVARSEEDLDILTEKLQSVGKERYIKHSCAVEQQSLSDVKNTGMVVCLSDLHIGSEWYHFTGNYNSDIAKKRLTEYLGEVIKIGKQNNVYEVVVIGLGDFISGQIHTTISLTNRENIVEQTKLACEYISDFVYEISKNFCKVSVHMVGGNHSRIGKKEDCLIDERLDLLPLWFMKNMFMHIDNIAIIEPNEELDSSMITFNLCYHNYLGIHGDYDQLNDSSITKLCMWSGMYPTAIFTGHKHYPAMTEVSGIKVIQSGSLCGTGDNHSREHRYKGAASQTITICNDNGVYAVYPITLK